MSLPTAAVAGMQQVIGVANPLDVLMTSINTNPYFIGLMMLLLNLGGRFLSLEITKEQEKFLSQPVVRRFFLFAILFVATRNIVIAAGLSFIMIILIAFLFNENSDLCLWKSCIHIPKEIKQEGFTGLTAEEAMIFKRLSDKQMAAKVAEEKEKKGSEEEKTDDGSFETTAASNFYYQALSKLNSIIKH